MEKCMLLNKIFERGSGRYVEGPIFPSHPFKHIHYSKEQKRGRRIFNSLDYIDIPYNDSTVISVNSECPISLYHNYHSDNLRLCIADDGTILEDVTCVEELPFTTYHRIFAYSSCGAEEFHATITLQQGRKYDRCSPKCEELYTVNDNGEYFWNSPTAEGKRIYNQLSKYLLETEIVILDSLYSIGSFPPVHIVNNLKKFDGSVKHDQVYLFGNTEPLQAFRKRLFNDGYIGILLPPKTFKIAINIMGLRGMIIDKLGLFVNEGISEISPIKALDGSLCSVNTSSASFIVSDKSNIPFYVMLSIITDGDTDTDGLLYSISIVEQI